jgi:hypothetical protein
MAFGMALTYCARRVLFELTSLHQLDTTDNCIHNMYMYSYCRDCTIDMCNITEIQLLLSILSPDILDCKNGVCMICLQWFIFNLYFRAASINISRHGTRWSIVLAFLLLLLVRHHHGELIRGNIVTRTTIIVGKQWLDYCQKY